MVTVPSAPPFPEFGSAPDTLLILGTDAAGKDYVATFIIDRLRQAGYRVERRSNWFSAAATAARSSNTRKGRIARLREYLFIAGFPWFYRLLPWLLPVLIRHDLRRFRRGPGVLVVISHTPLRVLAFYLAHRYQREADIRLPAALDHALRGFASATEAKVLMLHVAGPIRQRRIAVRVQNGTVDPFDAYMAQDGGRAERIERFLSWIARTYLGAASIENNDLNTAALAAAVRRAFSAFQENN